MSWADGRIASRFGVPYGARTAEFYSSRGDAYTYCYNAIGITGLPIPVFDNSTPTNTSMLDLEINEAMRPVWVCQNIPSTNPSRVAYTAPIAIPTPNILQRDVIEEVRFSTDDDVPTDYHIPHYTDSRGAGVRWSAGRVFLPAGATSSQLVVGDFSFKIPPNAVIKSVEIVVNSDALPSSPLTVDVMQIGRASCRERV